MKGGQNMKSFLGVVAGLIIALSIGLGIIYATANAHGDDFAKSPFTETYTLYSKGEMKLIFRDAYRANNDFIDVWVNVDNVNVQVDSALPGTALSASPEFRSRIDLFVYYEASSATVWVRNEEQKQQWEAFIEKAIAQRDRKQNEELPYHDIVPR